MNLNLTPEQLARDAELVEEHKRRVAERARQRREEEAAQYSLRTAQPDATLAAPQGRSNESPVGFGTRAAASFLRGDQRDRYLQRNLPEGYTLDEGGQTATGPQGRTHPIDPSGPDIGDIADIVGDIPVIAGGAIGGTGGSILGAPSGPLGAAAMAMGGAATGSFTGDMFRQGVGSMFEPERLDLESAAHEGKWGGYGEALAPGAIKALAAGGRQLLRGPRRLMQGGAEVSDVGKQAISDADRLREALGANITPEMLPIGTTSPSGVVQAADAQLRRSGVTGPMFKEQMDELTEGMTEAVGGIRRKIGGDPPVEAALDSGLKRIEVGDALIVNHDAQEKLYKEAMDEAHDNLVNAVGQPFDTIQISTPATDAIAADAAEKMAMQPAAAALPDVGAINEVLSRANTDNLRQLMALRGVAGDMMNNPSTADAGRRLYAAILSDMDSGLVDALPVGALQASEAMKAYKKLLGLARRQYEIDGSDLVRRLYPGGSPNVAKINQIAERIAQGVVDVPDIRLLKERVGAGFQGKTGIETQNILKGRSETIGLPKTERGEFLWDQVQQLYLDDLLMRNARNTNEPDKLALAGKQFYNKLFGTKKAKDVTQEIFGDVTPDLEAFANLIRDSGLSIRMFSGSPTQPLQELGEITSGGMGGGSRLWRTLFGLGAKYGGASQLAKPHLKGQGAMIGREFFQTGQLPNIQDWLHRHRKLAGATRLVSQTVVRGFRENRSPDSQQR